jgi:hypothetical protein
VETTLARQTLTARDSKNAVTVTVHVCVSILHQLRRKENVLLLLKSLFFLVAMIRVRRMLTVREIKSAVRNFAHITAWTLYQSILVNQ